VVPIVEIFLVHYHIITSGQLISSESPELYTLCFYWPSYAHYTAVHYIACISNCTVILVAVLSHTFFVIIIGNLGQVVFSANRK